MQVLKKEVDCFEEGKRIPVCQLQAIAMTPHQDGKPSQFFHSVKLRGTKEDHTYLLLFRPAIPSGTYTYCMDGKFARDQCLQLPN